MSDSNVHVSSGIGLGSALFIVFLVLKLCGKIDWSWWWVTAPLWIPPAILLGILAVVGVVALIVWLLFR